MIIGVTGGIGAGKSVIVSFFKSWGANVIDVDKLGWTVLDEKKNEVVKAFGRRMLVKSKIDRKELGKIVFDSAQNKRLLDSIIHPQLLKRLKVEIEQAQSSDPRPLVVDCALIYEWKIESWFNKIILVKADYDKKLARLVKMGYELEEARARIEAQLPDDKKKADFVIENNENLQALEVWAHEIWKCIVSNSG